MNYSESKEILEKINNANRILLSCHHHPDSDTVASATVLSSVLNKMGKTTKVICPDHVPPFLKFISGADKIETVKFENYNFNEWDLFIVCDTSNWDRLFIDKDFNEPTIPVVVIDNHSSNKGFGTLALLDYDTSSVAEMIFNILQDWEVSIDKDTATALFSGMAGDTGSFRFEVYKSTFHIAGELVESGADVRATNLNLFDTKPIELFKFLGVVIKNLVIENNFAYAAIPYEEYKDYVHIYGTREVAATDIIAKISGTDFGFVMTEEENNSCSVSFRSRNGIDTAKIALALGGGGHPAASGAWIRGASFSDTLEKILIECRKI